MVGPSISQHACKKLITPRKSKLEKHWVPKKLNVLVKKQSQSRKYAHVQCDSPRRVWKTLLIFCSILFPTLLLCSDTLDFV